MGVNPHMEAIRRERTLVFVKPDGVQRGLVGEIIARFERCGLKIVGMKMVWPTKEFLDRHYPKDETFLVTLGSKTREAFETYGMSLKASMGTDDLLEIGRRVRGWLLDYVSSAPVVAFVLEGTQATSVVRKIVGHTLPVFAQPGTIRGDFAIDSPTVANLEQRAIRNLVHASGNVEEAEKEISLWFSPEELFSYPRAGEEGF
ncbi:MAG: nucleoside-diphosphate kinase [Armatimonadota bacterium]|nr:nucleoside-diphosphate kinase [Armatimonadota bacterium]MDR5703849.1 nucleoside-diphosphate kinase [Armatimonadota bacterium]